LRPAFLYGLLSQWPRSGQLPRSRWPRCLCRRAVPCRRSIVDFDLVVRRHEREQVPQQQTGKLQIGPRHGAGPRSGGIFLPYRYRRGTGRRHPGAERAAVRGMLRRQRGGWDSLWFRKFWTSSAPQHESPFSVPCYPRRYPDSSWTNPRLRKSLILLARSDGFEPPTLRFEVCCYRFLPAYMLYDGLRFGGHSRLFYLTSESVTCDLFRSLLLTRCLHGFGVSRPPRGVQLRIQCGPVEANRCPTRPSRPQSSRDAGFLKYGAPSVAVQPSSN
jgi:hypothetical protein